MSGPTSGLGAGTAIRCREDGTIVEVVHDGLRLVPVSAVDAHFSDFLDPDSAAKGRNFLAAMQQQKVVTDWELNAVSAGQLVSCRFAGIREGDGMLVVIARTSDEMTVLIQDLARMGNEQATALRTAIKENSDLRAQLRQDSDLFNQISQLNNELVNLQRQLAKQNTELARLNELKNRFLGIAAHDLRNPLGNILLLVDFIRDEGERRLTDDQRKYLEQIASLGGFMLNLVDDLLDVSAIETGKLELQLEEQDLVAIIERNVTLSRMPAHKKRIAIRLDKQVDSAPIYLDRSKIEQVISNLLSNAIKYSKPETEITVRISRTNAYILTEVVDQGQGIAKEELETLFRPFQRTSTRSTGGEKSVGLGLYIVKRIVEAHQGKIWVESAPGRGSAFRFSLPEQTA